MKINHGNKVSTIGKYYYLIATLLSMLAMYTNLRNGLVAAGLMVLILLELSKKIFRKQKILVSSMSFWVSMYVIYNLITILFALLNNYPFSIIVREAANSIVPIVFYFYALKIPTEEELGFEKTLLISCGIIIISGIIYNLNLNDQHYIAFLHDAYPGFNMIGFIRYPRLTSWVGSVIVGTISNVGLCFAFNRFICNKNFKQFFLWSVILIIGVILSMQRSAIVFMGINLFGILWYSRVYRKIKLSHIICLVILSFITFSFLFLRNSIIFENFLERLFSLTGALSERSSQWSIAFDTGLQVLTGIGLGTGGHRAIGIVEKTINDGNYFKMLYEIGIMGTTIFLIIAFKSLNNGMRLRKKVAVYLFAITGMLIQAIGSNIFTFQFIAPLFWYCIGIVEKTRLNRKKAAYELSRIN